MGFHGAGTVERFLRKVLVPVCAASGAVVVSGFFFPDMVGAVVSGYGWLVIALLFFGSGLAYIAVLPTEDSEDAESRGAPYLMQIRRLSPVETTRDFLVRHSPVTFGVPVAVFALFFLLQVLAPEGTTAAVRAVQGVVTGEVDVWQDGAIHYDVSLRNTRAVPEEANIIRITYLHISVNRINVTSS